MTHRGFFGMSESGKTTLATLCALRFLNQGIPRIILDPLNDPRWKAVEGQDWVGRDPVEFRRLWRTNEQCALFIDESGKSIGRYAGEMNEVCTMARHWGHETHVIGQRPQQIDPTIRDQLGEVYLFACSPAVCKIFAEEFSQAELMQAATLRQFEFIFAKRFQKPRKGQVDAASGRVWYV